MFLLKQPKYFWGVFGYFEKRFCKVKNIIATFWANIWATFYLNIKSHWLQYTIKTVQYLFSSSASTNMTLDALASLHANVMSTTKGILNANFTLFPTSVITGKLSFNWAHLGFFFVYFRSFQTDSTNFTTNYCVKISIQYPALGFELTTF